MSGMWTECGVCGKGIVIHQPEFYVFRRGGTYFCSENCLIVHNTKLMHERNGFGTKKKGVEKMSRHKLTLEQKKKAVEIHEAGGDPLKWLEQCGAKNPSAAWFTSERTWKRRGGHRWRSLRSCRRKRWRRCRRRR